MSDRRRKALVDFARQRGAVIIEDDYDGEFRFHDNPLKALRAADPADVVFYVGTFSKCMLPALRLGFVVAPRWALRALVMAKNCLDWHCPTLIQLAVSGFIAEGHLAQHVRKMRQIYQKRRQSLFALLNKDLAQWLEPIPSSYGMHVTAVARSDLNLDPVVTRLLEGHVNIHTLERYYLGRTRQIGLVFGYGTTDLPQIAQGLAGLRRALSG